MISAVDRDHIIKIVADRMGTDSGDPRPGLLVHLAFAAGDYGFQRWIRQRDGDGTTLRDWVRRSLDSIVGRQWRGGPR